MTRQNGLKNGMQLLYGGRDGHDMPKLAHIVEHAEHCFDYLRQSILCHGDTTLEKTHPKGETKYGRNQFGWGDIHLWRSYQAIEEFAFENTVKKWTAWTEDGHDF